MITHRLAAFRRLMLATVAMTAIVGLQLIAMPTAAEAGGGRKMDTTSKPDTSTRTDTSTGTRTDTSTGGRTAPIAGGGVGGGAGPGTENNTHIPK